MKVELYMHVRHVVEYIRQYYFQSYFGWLRQPRFGLVFECMMKSESMQIHNLYVQKDTCTYIVYYSLIFLIDDALTFEHILFDHLFYLKFIVQIHKIYIIIQIIYW